jgi:hypothetical protein
MRNTSFHDSKGVAEEAAQELEQLGLFRPDMDLGPALSCRLDFGPALSCVRVLGCYGGEDQAAVLESLLERAELQESANWYVSKAGRKSPTEPVFDFDSNNTLWPSCEWMFLAAGDFENQRYHWGMWAFQVLKEARRSLSLISARELHSQVGINGETPIADDAHGGTSASSDGGQLLDNQGSTAQGVPPSNAESGACEAGEQEPVPPQVQAESELLADLQEGALLQRALLLSKMDMQEGNEVVLQRLTTYSDDVRIALLSAPELASCRDAVLAAGCDLEPSWGNGLKAFVPLRKCPSLEHELSGFCHHHVIIRRSDIPHLQATLRKLSSKKRPKYRHVQSLDVSVVDIASNAATGDASKLTSDGMEFVRALGVMVVNTFVHYPIPKDVSEASECVQSAPCASNHEPFNPRRWSA